MPSDIQFEEDGFSKGYSQIQSKPSASGYGVAQSGNDQTRGMTGWLIRHHLAKSPESAQLYLLALVIVNIIITIVALNILL